MKYEPVKLKDMLALERQRFRRDNQNEFTRRVLMVGFAGLIIHNVVGINFVLAGLPWSNLIWGNILLASLELSMIIIGRKLL